VISKDLWSAFDPAHPFDRRPARRYRDLILQPGGSKLRPNSSGTSWDGHSGRELAAVAGGGGTADTP
jgi:Zn-dependent oligopeptidase